MYFWTIAIGVPVLWFFVVPFYKFIRPWMVVVAAAAISGGVLSCIIWPHTSLHILVITLIFVVAIAGCVGIAVGLSELDERVSDQRKRRLGKTVAYATVLLWIVPLYLVLGLLVLVDEVIDPYWREWMAWFFKSRVAKVVYPWSVTLAGLLIGSWALLGTSTWVLVMVRIGVVIGAVTAFVLAAALVVLLVVGLKWVWQHIPWPSVSTAARPVKPVVDRGSSTASLYAHGLKAKKRRVCPRIQFPESL
jgi:hypothetical protein